MKQYEVRYSNYYWIFTLIYVVCLLISNVIAPKVISFSLFGRGLELPSAIILFPIVYILNDVLSEIYGFSRARKTILLGFGFNLFMVGIFTLILLMSSPEWVDVAAYKTVLGVSWRVFLGSMVAYLVGSLVNSWVMCMMKNCTWLSVRCIGSTMFGETLDSIIFITIVFYGVVNIETWAGMVLAQALIKIIYEIIAFPITRQVIFRVRKLENISTNI